MLKFEQALPEETGVPSECINRFTERLKKHGIPMHSFLMLRRDKLIFEGYYSPCTKASPHRMFSISKSFTSIAIGLLADEGKLALDDPVVKYFPEKLPANVHPWIGAMTIKDMLMMRTCHASTTYKKNMDSDWVESFFTTAPTHPAGTVFHYDTSASHTLCALAEKLSGMDMLDYIKKKLDVLNLSDSSYMLKDPFGVSMGGTGLVALPMDMLKFGYFIANRGNISGKQLISPSYIDMALSRLSDTCVTAPLPSEAQGYGLMFWRGEHDSHVCYGMGGQLIIILPEYELILVTTADTQNTAGGNQQIYDAVYEEILPYIENAPLPVSREMEKLISDTASSLKIEPLISFPAPDFAKAINGKTFFARSGVEGFESFRLDFFDNASPENTGGGSNAEAAASSQDKSSIDYGSQSCGALTFIHKNKTCSVNFGIGSMATGSFPIYDMRYCASGAWLSDHTFYIMAHIIDAYVGTVHFQLSFKGNELTVFMRKKEESLFTEFDGHVYCQA